MTDVERALAIEVAQLPDDGLLAVLNGEVTLTTAEQVRKIQADLARAPRYWSAQQMAAFESTLLAFRKGTVDQKTAPVPSRSARANGSHSQGPRRRIRYGAAGSSASACAGMLP